jgi:hypothetical protein
MAIGAGGVEMTKKRFVLVLVGLVLLGIVALLLVAFRRDRRTDDEKVEAVLTQCSHWTEVESARHIVDLLSEDYTDDLGDSKAALRSNIAQVFVGPTEWRVSWTVGAMRPLDDRHLRAELTMDVRQLTDGQITFQQKAPLTVTFVREGRELKVQRLEGLRVVAESVEREFGGE